MIHALMVDIQRAYMDRLNKELPRRGERQTDDDRWRDRLTLQGWGQNFSQGSAVPLLPPLPGPRGAHYLRVADGKLAELIRGASVARSRGGGGGA
mmetsp:Transcript_20676/g.54682  ORF Transcript_20676/g.54682 Transcript_20676/m.54682 type:complete len:95 (-) Transcript_20676:484-768(-)